MISGYGYGIEITDGVSNKIFLYVAHKPQRKLGRKNTGVLSLGSPLEYLPVPFLEFQLEYGYLSFDICLLLIPHPP